ncbi:unnamed protein product [Rhizophagus irregularis]|uniref:Uncharacterized protein n=1 Tax=Rhizophagus irregularis TaxID=588596 RepID=A0A915YWV3_9GLOM|nr:unnamed protein product [Rhizophagus irregularis]
MSEVNDNLEINRTSCFETDYTSSRLFTSKVHRFENFPKPRNATEEEQEAFHSKSYDNFNIPDNIDDFNKSINRENDTLKGSEDLSKALNDLQINTKDDTQSNYKMETMQLRVKKYDDIDDEKEIHNDPNLHSEEQDELEIPDEI